ncbi:hypothetical protein AB0C34_18820 [Nocardia sp. NPDC049220]|uniref:hypothetical protein n=1 Tax=Nocardia sp. NPDC049220 TaxID=3155273 RepID=UPI0033FBE446
MNASNRRREQAELEVEEVRLDVVYGVLSDMAVAAGDASSAKGYRGADFEMSRIRHANVSAQVDAERTAVWDRLLDYRHTPATAARIRVRVAADRDRKRRERSGGIGRSR